MTSLDDILDLTDRVEASLDDGDWIAAAQLNAERQELLTALFADRAPGDMDQETRDILRDILARNETAAAKVRLEQELVATKQQRVHHSAAAVLAYEQAAATAGAQG